VPGLYPCGTSRRSAGPSSPRGPYTDHGALYALIFTDDDGAEAWLRAGEALSAVLLTATAAGLGTAPISDVTELDVTREQLRRMLAGIGVPQLAVRIGHPPAGGPPPTGSAPCRRRKSSTRKEFVAMHDPRPIIAGVDGFTVKPRGRRVRRRSRARRRRPYS
jgi:hypothetical protein